MNSVTKRILSEDGKANRSESFSIGRNIVCEIPNIENIWDTERWFNFSKAMGYDFRELMDGVNYQVSVNESVKAAIGGCRQ